MSGSVQDGGEGRKGDGVREWNRDGKIARYYYTGLETMPRIKNAARLRKINTAPSLSLSLFSVKYHDVPFHVKRTRERERENERGFSIFPPRDEGGGETTAG